MESLNLMKLYDESVITVYSDHCIYYTLMDDFHTAKSRSNVNVIKNMTFTINPPGDAHGSAEEICRLEAAQIRRGKRQSKKTLSFAIINPFHSPI